MPHRSRLTALRRAVQRAWIAALSGLIGAGLAGPAAAAGEGAQLRFYGTFRSISTPRPPDEVPPDIRLGNGWIGPRPVRQTDRIPATKGSLFGVLFVPRAGAGGQGGTLKLRSIIHFPVAGLVNPGTGERVYGTSRSIECISGFPCLAAMGLQADWEIAVGEWAIEVQAEDGTPLVVKRFSVVPPSEIEPVVPHPAARHPFWAMQVTLMCLAAHPELRTSTPMGRKIAETHPEWTWGTTSNSPGQLCKGNPSISPALCEAVLNGAFEENSASIPRLTDRELDPEVIALGPLFERFERSMDPSNSDSETTCPPSAAAEVRP